MRYDGRTRGCGPPGDLDAGRAQAPAVEPELDAPARGLDARALVLPVRRLVLAQRNSLALPAGRLHMSLCLIRENVC